MFLSAGPGLRYGVVDKADPLLTAEAPWTISCWFRQSGGGNKEELLAGMGEVTSEYSRFLALTGDRVELVTGLDRLSGRMEPGGVGPWRLVTATFDGVHARLYSQGKLVADGMPPMGAVSPVLQLAPAAIAPAQGQHFAGAIANFLVLRLALSADEIGRMATNPPKFDVLLYEEGSKPWPLQTRGQAGYRGPQSPAEMPTGRASISTPRAIIRPPQGFSLVASDSGFRFDDGWQMRAADAVTAKASQIASSDLNTRDWLRATVPGTVLTTLVDDGVYPDPYYGLNNLAIPETLNKQGYWYRNSFLLPAQLEASLSTGNRVQLRLEGINYHAQIWLNGAQLGEMKGAFRRGTFDITSELLVGRTNVLAVRIDPPPHPGIPHEQSILGGAGENGGAMELDGPTFLATEGWDWLPAIRDRDSGIWQPVTLLVTGPLRLGDTQVVSHFEHHDMTHTDLNVHIPIVNMADHAVSGIVSVALEGRTIRKRVQLPSGAGSVTLAASEYPELRITRPRLWWPNGYGKPELYTAHIQISENDGSEQRKPSDTKTVRFGVREVSYELSVLNSAGDLQRIEYTPAAAVSSAQPVIDVSHEGIREIASADAATLNVPEAARNEYPYQSFVYSMGVGAEHSTALEESADLGTAPYLVIKMNGVRIAARGGSWGMDDAMKRVSRERLEPYFRLQRDANMNIIRNWVGQNTEETFFELADEYGMMVWNDFWESTQNYNIEAEDPELFLANAKDTIERFRNHPSIVLWCGRNEGVPQPILNQGLEALTRTLDGTRFYAPSSNQINLQVSGPYSYQDPSLYFTTLNRGFSVETGTPSLSTLESLRSSIPEADQWPIDDVWAYHDWHFGGNGRVQPFMREVETEFGAGTSLADFERKAQMLNYVNHRAIFEGMNANLWQPNSGRMLWMTQPAWPSNVWQILSSDYDTQASFYGAQKGAEPVHVQLNPVTGQVDVVNTTPQQRKGLTVTARVVSLTNAPLMQVHQTLDVTADSIAHATNLPLSMLLKDRTVLIELMLGGEGGAELSRNLYWLADEPSHYRQLASLSAGSVEMRAVVRREGKEAVISVTISNNGTAAVLNNKLTLLNRAGERILPAYYSDNYLSLLPGETQTVSIRFSAAAGGQATISLRGFNVSPRTIAVKMPD